MSRIENTNIPWIKILFLNLKQRHIHSNFHPSESEKEQISMTHGKIPSQDVNERMEKKASSFQNYQLISSVAINCIGHLPEKVWHRKLRLDWSVKTAHQFQAFHQG